MKSKLILSVVIVLTLVVTLIGNAGVARANATCDPAFVSKVENVITVKPTGDVDTANLQCAFDLAIATGPGVDVSLTEGIFHIAQIVVNDFHGSFSGAGAEKTVIYSVQNMYVTPVDFFMEPPSVQNPWPSLFSFFNGAYQIHDLGLRIPNAPTTPWTFWGSGPFPSLMFGFGVFGTHVDVVVRDVVIQGEISADGYFSLFNGIYVWGLEGDVNPPISGSLFIERSTFNTMAYGTPTANWLNLSATITRNRYIDNWVAVDGYGLEKSTLIFTQNKIEFQRDLPFHNHVGAMFYDMLPAITGSTFLFANNHFEGDIGIMFMPIMGAGNSCVFLGNNTQEVREYPLVLGWDTHDCKVIGGVPKIAVLDLGTNNILVGVNNMGIGVGPVMPRFLRP